MVKVRALRYEGSWTVSRISFPYYVYGKLYIALSKDFRDGAKMKALKLIMPWDYKYLA